MFEAFSAVTESAPYLFEGMCVTLALVGGSPYIGFLSSIVLTLGQVYGPWIVKRIEDDKG